MRSDVNSTHKSLLQKDESCNMALVVAKMSGHVQTQLTRSLERLLEEAYLSGELKLTGRKLKDFPNVGEKYNLSDTVFAGAYTVLSKRLACQTALLVGRAGPMSRDVKSVTLRLVKCST